MAKRFALGTFTEDGNFGVDLVKNEISGCEFGVLLAGTFGGGSVRIRGGLDIINERRIRPTDTSDGSVNTIGTCTVAGLYQLPFDLCCIFIKIVMLGATNPDLAVTLFVKPRGA